MSTRRHVIIVLCSTFALAGTVRGQVSAEEGDRLPGVMVGPTRAEIEDLIRTLGRDPASPELVDRIDSLYRPRCASQRTFADLKRKLADKEFIAKIDAIAVQETGRMATTRALIFRTTGVEGDSFDVIRQAFKDDREREEGTWKTLRGKVMEEGLGGRPIQGAVVAGHSGVMTRTDSKGNYVLKVRAPKGEIPLILNVEAAGCALIRSSVDWAEMPESDTKDFRLPEAVPFGGRVIDAKGRPIAGAELDLSMHGEAVTRDATDRKMNFATSAIFKTRTDDQGRYAFRNIPPDLPDRQAAISLTLTHPKFLSRQKQYAPNELLGPGWEITLEPGCVVSGVVRDEEGKPLANASVQATYNPEIITYPTTKTDAEGRFRFENLAQVTFKIVVRSPDHVLTVVEVDAKKDAPADLKITLEAGVYFEGKVIGEDGKPADNAMVGWLEPIDEKGRVIVPEFYLGKFSSTKVDGSFRVGPVTKGGRYKVTALVEPPRAIATIQAETDGKPLLLELKPDRR